MESHKLNWFERYVVGLMDVYGGGKGLFISALCSFGFAGFMPQLVSRETITQL